MFDDRNLPDRIRCTKFSKKNPDASEQKEHPEEDFHGANDPVTVEEKVKDVVEEITYGFDALESSTREILSLLHDPVPRITTPRHFHSRNSRQMSDNRKIVFHGKRFRDDGRSR